MTTLRTVELSEADDTILDSILRRSAVPDAATRRIAGEIVEQVKTYGDRALAELSARFGGASADNRLAIPADELAAAWTNAPADLRDALGAAADTIRTVHEPQRPADAALESRPGVRVERRWTPLGRVGVYVPGGRAPYPSSLLMGVVPAQIAGVTGIAVTTPADPAGYISPALLAAAGMLGVEELYVVGGAQAVAALAYGTDTIPRVDKIVGPGNAWVTAAKLAVYGDCAVDLPAGPSEALIVADHTADPVIVAADLLCQAEHGPDSPVILVTTSAEVAADAQRAITALLPRLSRAEILEKSLADHGLIVRADSLEHAVAFANRYAPEHLSVHTLDSRATAEHLTAAGSVFVGHWSPESAGDYATGANHVLPTGGLAASYGPLSVEDFGSWRQVQELTKAGLEVLRPTITTLADAEGLSAHRLAAEIRFEQSP